MQLPASYKYPPFSRESEKQQRLSVYTADEHVDGARNSLSLPLFFLTSFPLSLLFIFLLLHYSACYRVSLTFSAVIFFLLSSVISPHLPSSPMISLAYLSILRDLPPLLSRVRLSLLFCLPPLIDVVVTRRAEFNGLLCKLWRVMG